MSEERPRALYYVAPRRAELRRVPEQSGPDGPEICSMRTLWSGISRGTERLIFEGVLPPSEWKRMRAPFQEGEFPHPVKYGYSAVGIVEEGPKDLLGSYAFCLFPHQERFRVPASAVIPLPTDVPPRRAILAANMETALNIIWDSGASAGDRISIVGGGIVGLLVSFLAARLPGAEVTVIDLIPQRAEIAREFGAKFALPTDAPKGADVVIHTSASEAGAQLALTLAAPEGTIVEASWFGDLSIRLPLGADFHSQRLRLVSSQVGMLPASRRSRWTHRRRLEKAVTLLQDGRLDRMITGEADFASLDQALPHLLNREADGLMTAVRYDR